MLKPVFDMTVIKKLLRVVVFNMPFKNKFVHVIVGDAESGFTPDTSDITNALHEMATKDQKNFGDTVFLTTNAGIKFRPMRIESLKKKITFVIVGDENTKYDDVEFKKIELEVKAAFESAKLSTTRVVVLRYPVQMVSGDDVEEAPHVEVRKPGVDTKAS